MFKAKPYASQQHIVDHDLETKSKTPLGSIIFFNDSYGQAEHVGILTSIHKGSFYITHAVQGKYNRVIESILQPGQYSMFTPTDIDLKFNILANARKAALEKIDYDIPRIELSRQIEDEMPFCHPVTGLAAMYELARTSHEQNIWRRIKYFARKEKGLVNNRGLMCSQLACILIQNSEPGQERVIDIGMGNWVTDKHFLPHQEIDSPSCALEASFKEYQGLLREPTSTGEYPQSNLVKKPPREEVNPIWHNSYQVWKKKEDLLPQSFYENSALPLDSKVTSPKVMQYHMQRSPDSWGDEKTIDITEPFVFDEEQKDRWKLFCRIHEKHQDERTSQQFLRRMSPSAEELEGMAKRIQEEDAGRELSPTMELFDSLGD